MIYDDASLGGYFVGKLHSEGGIKMINKSTGQPLEVQGSEVIITAPAVSDQTKRNFEGKMMTNREILSKINSDGGGVSFADGGDIPAKIHTTDKEYEYGGKMVHDSDIAHSLGMNSTLKKGKQHFSSGGKTYEVDAIYNAVKKNKLRLKTKEVPTFAMKYPVYDKQYSETVKTDFRKPNGITVRTESGEEVLIDGNHRMNNAYLKGKKTMKTYYIEDPKQIAKFTKNSKFELGGENKDFKYSKPFGEITIFTNVEQEYVGDNYSPFENKGSFKATIRKGDLENIALESKDLANFNFEWGVDNWTTISKKLKQKNINELELYSVGKQIKTFQLRPLVNDEQQKGNYEFKKGGHLAKGKSLKQIAEMHNVSLAHVNEELAKGLKVEKEHFVDFKERTRVAKDHLVENPNYYSILAKAGLEKGGKIEKEDLVKDAKSGNTPARDLNNYNDLLDVQADREVGGDSGIFAEGGITPYDANLEGDSVSIADDDFATGGVVYNPKNPKIEKVTIKETKFNRGNVVGRNASTISDLQFIVRDYLGYSPKEETDWIKFYVNDNTRGSYYIDLNKGKKNTVKNVNPETLNSLNFKRVIDANTYLIRNYDWTDFFNDQKQTPISSQSPASTSNKPFDLANTKIWIGNNPELSKRVQEYAFANGFSWANGGEKIPLLTGEPSLVFDKDDFTVTYRSNRADFEGVNAREIIEEDIFGTQMATNTTPASLTDLKGTKILINNNNDLAEKVIKKAEEFGFKNNNAIKDLLKDEKIYGLYFNNHTYIGWLYKNNFKDSSFREITVNDLFGNQTPTSSQAPASISTKPFDFTDTKIDVINNSVLSKRIQEKAFESGWEWEKGGGKNINYDKFNYLYFTKTSISSGNTTTSFVNSPKRKITEADVFGNQTPTSTSSTTSTPQSNTTTKPKLEGLFVSNGDIFSNIEQVRYYLDNRTAGKDEVFFYVKNSGSNDFVKVVLSTSTALTTGSQYYNRSAGIDFKYETLNKLFKATPSYNKYDWTDFLTTLSNVDYEVFLINLNYEINGKPNFISDLRDGVAFVSAINNIQSASLNKDVTVKVSVAFYKKDNIKGTTSEGLSENIYFGNGKFEPNKMTVSEIKWIITNEWFDGKLNFDNFFKSVVSSNTASTSTTTPSSKPLLRDLSQTKIKVDSPELSKRIQERAFELGWTWGRGSKKPKDLDKTFLFFKGNMSIVSGSNFTNFQTNTNKEIFADDLFPNATATSTSSTSTQPPLTPLPIEDLLNSKMWIGDNVELKDKVIEKLIEIGLPLDSSVGNADFSKNIYVQIYNKDFVVWEGLGSFNNANKKEIFPNDLGIDVTNISGATNTQNSTSASTNLSPITDIENTKIWINNNYDLAEKVIQKGEELGWTDNVGIKEHLQQKKPITSIFFTKKYAGWWEDDEKGFDEKTHYKEIFPIDLGINVNNISGATTTQTPTSSSKFTAGEIKLFKTIDKIVEEYSFVVRFPIDYWNDGITTIIFSFQDDFGNVFHFRSYNNKFGIRAEDPNNSKAKELLEKYLDWKSSGVPTSATTSSSQPNTNVSNFSDSRLKIFLELKEIVDKKKLTVLPANIEFKAGKDEYGLTLIDEDTGEAFTVNVGLKKIKPIDKESSKFLFDFLEFNKDFEAIAREKIAKSMVGFVADESKLYTKDFEKYETNLTKSKKDLEDLKKLLPAFQETKFAPQRAMIINEIKKLNNKITKEGFIFTNELMSNSNQLFTPQGLLKYYFDQTTQSPVQKLEPACNLPTPNGMKSKLPLSAYFNVRTKQFKDWFGDWEKAYETNNYFDCSKAIDEETKEPKIFFHGVRKYIPNFGQFSNMGQGVVRPYGSFEPPSSFPASFFSDSEEYAKFYGGIAKNMPTPSPDYEPFIYKVFLSIKNELNLVPLGFEASYKDVLDYLYVAYGIKKTPSANVLSRINNDMVGKHPVWVYIRNDISLLETIKEYGYDTLVQIGDIPTFDKDGNPINDRDKSIKEEEFLTFYPNQVKSATVLKSFYFDFFKDIRFNKGGYVCI